ncbi:MAG: type II toxin-antitoxin system HipA family toxin [Salinarimonas sp.]
MLMALRSARVYLKGRHVGILAETSGGGTRFTYDPNCGEPIACALPVKDREHVWRAGLHPFFEHLAPEGWLREQQAHRERIDDQDDFGLLLRFGRDCIGAVGIGPLDEGAAALAGAGAGESVVGSAVGARRTLSGAQRKLLAFRADDGFRPSGPGSPATHIAKLNERADADLVRNEALSLRLAADLLGRDEVTRFEPGWLGGVDEAALLVERFDRTLVGDKLRLEDLAQILSRPRGRDFQGKYDGSYEEAAEAVARHSARPRIDVARYFERVVVCFMLGNADAHLKNFALLERPEGLRLSPAYDIVNTLFYAGRYDERTALAIDGDKPPLDEIDRARLLRFGAAIGLGEKAVTSRLDRLASRLARSSSLSRPAGAAPSEFHDRYSEIVHRLATGMLAR